MAQNILKVDIRIYVWNVDYHEIKDINYQNVFHAIKFRLQDWNYWKKKRLVLAHRYPLNYRDKKPLFFLSCEKEIKRYIIYFTHNRNK